jgi:hypothetical protein
MNDIKQLTIGDIQQLQQFLGGSNNSTKKGIYDRYIGKYVICRTQNEGVNAGQVIELDETGVILKDARRLYYYKPAHKNTSWYEGVAIYGLAEGSKVGISVEKIIVEDYSLTICSPEAECSIREFKAHVQN